MFSYVHSHVRVIWSYVCACMFGSVGLEVYVCIQLCMGLHIYLCMYVCMHSVRICAYVYVYLLLYECKRTMYVEQSRKPDGRPV